jgi:hypothetical protein
MCGQIALSGVLLPQVVNPDHNAEDVGVMGQAIMFPSVLQIANGITVDTFVFDTDIEVWILCQEIIGDEVDVAKTKRAIIWIVVIGIGNTISYEKNCLVCLKLYWFSHNQFQIDFSFLMLRFLIFAGLAVLKSSIVLSDSSGIMQVKSEKSPSPA